MKKVILTFIALATVAASAATTRLGSATFDAKDDSATIDARSSAIVSEVTLKVTGETLHFGDIRVVYRTGNGFGPYKSTLFHVNKVVQAGGSIVLDLPNTGYPIRRIELEGSSAGFNRDAYVTAYGSN